MKPIVELIIYTIITMTITILLLKLFKKKIKNDSTKDLLLIILPIITIFIHLSIIVYDNVIIGEVGINFNLFLPIYPCNVIMWLLLILGLIKNKKGIVFKRLSEFCFLGGTICGTIGILFNINFLNNPSFLDYNILKGLISHNIMVLNCLYLFSMNYVSIRLVSNIKSAIVGLLIFVFCGGTINLIFKLIHTPSVNSMYMEKPPLEKYPMFNFLTMGILGLIILFNILAIYEQITLEKEQRWYYKLLKENKA